MPSKLYALKGYEPDHEPVLAPVALTKAQEDKLKARIRAFLAGGKAVDDDSLRRHVVYHGRRDDGITGLTVGQYRAVLASMADEFEPGYGAPVIAAMVEAVVEPK